MYSTNRDLPRVGGSGMAKSSWRDAKGIRWLPEARRMALPDAERAEYDAALAEEVRKRKAARRSVKGGCPESRGS